MNNLSIDSPTLIGSITAKMVIKAEITEDEEIGFVIKVKEIVDNTITINTSDHLLENNLKRAIGE